MNEQRGMATFDTQAILVSVYGIWIYQLDGHAFYRMDGVRQQA
jgi:hypothetical protein